MMKLITAIDPGDKHCGVAWFSNKGTLVQTLTWTPDQVICDIETMVSRAHAVVCEEYRLYPWLAAEQGFSEFLTCELIGVIKYLTHQRKIDLYMQPASIKKPTEGHLRSRGIVLQGHSRHEKDAELHGYHWQLNPEGRKLWVR